MVALGVTWILDGLEVTIVGAIAPVLQNSQMLGLSAGQIGAAGSAYVTGAVVGALLFGWLTDRSADGWISMQSGLLMKSITREFCCHLQRRLVRPTAVTTGFGCFSAAPD
jgi:MFS family permease